jgi:hypothetical protein
MKFVEIFISFDLVLILTMYGLHHIFHLRYRFLFLCAKLNLFQRRNVVIFFCYSSSSQPYLPSVVRRSGQDFLFHLVSTPIVGVTTDTWKT